MKYQLADLFEAVCDAKPEAEYLLAGERRYTRLQLDERANRLAHYLVAQGIQPGDHIGVYAYNRGEWIEALLACWKIRAIAININFRYVSHELRYIWEHSDMVGLIYERGFTPLVAELAGDFPAIQTYLCLDDGSDDKSTIKAENYETALAGQSAERNFPAPYSARTADDILMIYTGGTTGMPKGVLWRHEDFYHNVICMNKGTDKPEDILNNVDNTKTFRTMTLSPLMHGGGQFAVLITLLRGGFAVIPVSKSLNTDEVLTAIQNEKLMMLSLIGDAMARPIAEVQVNSDKNYDVSSLSIISSGGAILTDPARDLLKQAFGENLYITGGIGGSEIGSAAREAGSTDKTKGPRFQGNDMMAVLDENLEVIKPGEKDSEEDVESRKVGMLAMKGFIPLGYYKAEAKTAEVFKTDKNGVRWVLAGDRAKVESDGTFTLVGRDSQCINSGGEKIFVEEVERAVSLHSAVRFCAVVGVPDPKWQQKVVVLVELEKAELEKGKKELGLKELQDHCREYISGYKLPRELVLTTFKRTPNGKTNYVWAKDYALQQLKII